MTIKDRMLSLIKPRHTAYAMAGSYPDAPSRRMGWDSDGTVMLHSEINGWAGPPSPGDPPPSPLTETSQSEMTATNSENSAEAILASSNSSMLFGFVFPELREIDGVFALAGPVGEISVAGSWLYDSADTTNFYDGTWAEGLPAFDPTNPITVDSYRDNIDSMARPAKKGMRILYDQNGVFDDAAMFSFHIYGVISPGETPDRILFLDTENSDAVFTKVLDFGDVPRGQTTTRTFKIKNNSGSKSINTVQVTAEDLFLNAGSWYTFGSDGVNYQGTHTVGNMSNGAEETIHLKQVIPGGETLGVQAGRILVSHTSVT